MSREVKGPGPEEPDELGFVLPKPATLGKTRATALVVGILLVLGVAFAIGYLPRRDAREQLAVGVAAAESAAPHVEVITPKPLTSDHALLLPGTVQPLEETIIYPRADGYIRKWTVDIGDKVAAGQLLAEIDVPEVDKELAQARAQLAQARATVAQTKANAQLSKVNLDRYQKLAQDKFVAASDLDQRQAQSVADQAAVTAAAANVDAQAANVARLQDLRTFASVTAPFAGTITQRSVERGALVTGTTRLYTLAAVDPVRVFIQVPQDVAPSVRVGLDAPVNVREFPGKPFAGKVARFAGALDPALRAMNTEVRVPNPKSELMPGMYAEVALSLPSPHHLVEVPATALYNDANGLRMAIVDAQSKIQYVPVTIERDTGAALQISTGLTGQERVVKLADVTLVSGMTVEVAQAPAAPAAPAAAEKK